MKIVFLHNGYESLAIEALSAALKKAGFETGLVIDPCIFDESGFWRINRLARFFEFKSETLAELKADLVILKADIEAARSGQSATVSAGGGSKSWTRGSYAAMLTERRELEGRIAQYEQQRTQTQVTQQTTQATQTQAEPGVRTFTSNVSPAELDRLADLRARQMRFNERCNESVATGRKAYQDFDAKVDDLRKVAPTVDAQGRPMLPETLVSAALATGRAHEVLYALGSDQSEADRIMSIGDPTSQAVAVAQYAAGLKKADDEGGTTEPPAKRTTEVPAPIRQVVGGSRKVSVKDMDLDDPALPIEEFMRRRDEEAKHSRRANGRFR